MKFKKVITLAMAAVLGAALLTGCGSSNDTQEAPAEGDTTACCGVHSSYCDRGQAHHGD